MYGSGSGSGSETYHERFGVASERVLEEAGQLRVAVGHVRALAVGQRRDDVAQRRQAPVDLRRLAQPQTRRAALGLALAARQVHLGKRRFHD